MINNNGTGNHNHNTTATNNNNMNGLMLNNNNTNSNTNNNVDNDTIPPTFKVDVIKKRIAKKSFQLVKKTAHNQTRKPYTELAEAVPNSACALALFEGFEPKSDTSRLLKFELQGSDQVVAWLGGANKYIHPVKYDGKVISFGGSGTGSGGAGKPFVYAWAKYESLQAKFDKKGASLSLKFRTKMVGSGRPAEGSDIPPSFGM